MNKETFVIVGGTKGVGKQVVIELIKNGSNVVFGGRDEIAANDILNELKDYKDQIYFVPTDITKVKDCENLFKFTVKKFKTINGLFNYSGITPIQSLLDCTEEVHDEVFNVNLKGAIFCSKYAIKYMKESGGGSIIFTGSPHAWIGEIDRVSYACSKGALITLSDHIAKHYAQYNIRSNYITMGWTPTDGELELRKNQGMSEEELRTLASNFIPMGRMSEIEDIVPAIIYLLSNKSKMVSGSNLRITGGWFM